MPQQRTCGNMNTAQTLHEAQLLSSTLDTYSVVKALKQSSFQEARLRHFFGVFLKKHKACIGELFYFIAKKDEN